MKIKILEKATDMFLNYGFKSVTMDDIANKMGISKKTIYAHYVNKTKLVEDCTMHLFDTISQGIDHICSLGKNPIEELYEIKKFAMVHLKDEKSSPQYQLQKYYPKFVFCVPNCFLLNPSTLSMFHAARIVSIRPIRLAAAQRWRHSSSQN